MASRVLPYQAAAGATWPDLWRSAWRAARTGLVGVPVGLAVFALLVLATWASLGRDLPAARAQVAAAFASGALQAPDYRLGDTQIGWHQYNDCLILWQAIDQRAAPAQLMVSPLLDPHNEDSSRCERLRAFAAGVPAAAAIAPTYYHRYLHGHTTLARTLLPVMSVERIRLTYHLTLTLLVVAGIGLALWGLARGAIVPGLFWLVVFLAFARWFGLESFGQSLGHGPADIVHLSFLAALAAAGVSGGIGGRAAIGGGAVFGGLVMVFEFLTGGLHLGLAAVIGGLPFALSAEARRSMIPIVAAAAAAFCAAAITVYAAKMLLAFAVFGSAPFVDAAAQLQMRAGLGGREGEAVELIASLKKLLKGFQGLAAGMPALALAMTALAAAAGLWAARRIHRAGSGPLRTPAALLLLSNLAILALLALLWQHSVVHAWFMHRTFAWTIGSGLALFLLAVLPVERDPAQAK